MALNFRDPRWTPLSEHISTQKSVQGMRGHRHLPPQPYQEHVKECGGSAICEHNRKRSECTICWGASICHHKRIKSRYKECDRSPICQHNCRRSKPVTAWYAGAPASAPTTVSRASAKSVAGRRYASITTEACGRSKSVQGMRGRRHLPPQPCQENVEGVYRVEDMRA